MNPTFLRVYGQLGRATFGLLLAALSVYALTVASALLGLPDAVISFRGVAASLGYVFGALLALFLLGSLTASVIRWVDRRGQGRDAGSL